MSVGSRVSQLDIDMKKDYDIAQERRSIKASWNAFSWVMVTFTIIALAGWLVGYLLR